MSDQPQSADELAIIHSFATFIQNLEGGALHAELSEKLQEICANMSDHSASTGATAKGKLTITLDFSLGRDRMFEITAEHKTMLPKEKRGRSVMWATPGNKFTLNHPKQLSMFPRDVTRESEAVRNV